MDLSLPIRITRDVVNRCGLRQLTGVYHAEKPDGSRVTDIDPLIEHIVLDHVKYELGRTPIVVREEATALHIPSVREISGADFLLTVDGVDGTGRFISHFNHGEKNAQWLVAMTALYQRNPATGNFRPILSFAYQPTTDCLFALTEGHPVLVEDPLGTARVFQLNANRLDVSAPRGTIDVYLKTDHCPHTITENLVLQWGPSGFNAVSILSCCAVDRQPTHTETVNFTSFHYTLWDFGLWPILAAAGLNVVDSQDITRSYTELDIHLFGDEFGPPRKIRRPLLIAHRELLPALQGVIRERL